MKRFLTVTLVLFFAGAALFAQTAVQSQNTHSTTTEAAAQASKPGASASGAAASETASQASAAAAGKGVNAAAAQDSQAAGDASARLAPGTVIPARLTKSIDSKKAKEGDPVIAKATSHVKSDGQVVIPKGTKLVGRVTRADARARGKAESALGIAFDRAILKDGREMPLSVVIQAVAAAETATTANLSDDVWMSSGTSAGASGGGGGLLGGAGATAGAVTGTAVNTAGNTVSTAAQTGAGVAGGVAGTAGQAGVAAGLTSNTTGVIGLEGLTLQTQASNTTQGSVVASNGSSVRLESGTRLMLRAGAEPK